MIKKLRGQVWIETVIYTLIGLALIALVLSYAMPKINELKDNALVEQSINAMNGLNDKIIEVRNNPGSRKVVDFTLKSGEMNINPINNSISLNIGGINSAYSEPGVEISVGKVKVLTENNQKNYDVIIKLVYPSINITYSGQEEDKKFDASSNPYKLTLTNKGVRNKQFNIDINQV
jgi:type II secretory pathway pseudopilin PulG